MNPFPFTQTEWDEVDRIATAIVNASAMEDEVLHASRFADLQGLLAALAAKYGEHPVLIETEADFTSDPRAQIRLYNRAIALALANGLPTCTIRISLARVLLDESQPEAARQELLACEGELAKEADDSERKEWSELMGRCQSA